MTTFGRLEHSRAAAPMSEINMTPLIDVMLVLLVIFILTAPLLASSIRLELPRSQAAQAQPAARSVRVSLDKSGQLFFNEQALSLQALQQKLIDTALADAKTEIQLRADASVSYDQLLAVMGAAQQAGLSRIGFVAKP
jgi:biopolymer transport protein TolR